MKGKFVHKWIYTFSDAQQLHKRVPPIRSPRSAAGQTGRSRFQFGTQVGAALQGLDHGVSRGAWGDDGAVLCGGALVRLDHIGVEVNILLRCNGQQAAIFHQQLNPGIAHGAHGFSFLQFVARLDGAADALGIDCKNRAVAGDCSDSSELGHGELQ